MAMKILALDGLTDTKLCSLVEELLVTIPGVKSAQIDFLSQRLTMSIEGVDTAETVKTVVYMLRKNLPRVTIRLTETGSSSLSESSSYGGGFRRDVTTSDDDDEDDDDDVYESMKERSFAFLPLKQYDPYITASWLCVILSSVFLLIDHLVNNGPPILSVFLSCGSLLFAVESNIVIGVTPKSNPAHWHYPLIFLCCILFFLGGGATPVVLLLAYCLCVQLLRRLNRREEKDVERCIDLGSDHQTARGDSDDDTPLSALQDGDLLNLTQGQTVLLDGVVENGRGLIKPFLAKGTIRAVSEGEVLHSGDMLLEGEVTMKIAGTLEASLASFLRESLLLHSLDDLPSVISSKNWELAIVLFGAATTMLLPSVFYGSWWNADRLVLTLQLLIVVLFPCCLPASVTLLQRGGIVRAINRGFLPGSARLLSLLSHAKTVVFGFSGVLTEDEYEVEELQLAEELDQREFLALVANVEAKSKHPMATAIHSKCVQMLGYEPSEDQVIQAETIPGYGVRAMLSNHQTVIIGSERLMQELDVQVPPNFDGRPRAYVCIRNEFSGVFLLSRALKTGADRPISLLRQSNTAVCVLSRCDAAVTRDAAIRLGADYSLSAAGAAERRKKLEGVLRGPRENTILISLPKDIAELGGRCICIELGEPEHGRIPAPLELLCEENDPEALTALLQLSQRLRRASSLLPALALAGKALLFYLLVWQELPMLIAGLGCCALSLFIHLLASLFCPSPPSIPTVTPVEVEVQN